MAKGDQETLGAAAQEGILCLLCQRPVSALKKAQVDLSAERPRADTECIIQCCSDRVTVHSGT